MRPLSCLWLVVLLGCSSAAPQDAGPDLKADASVNVGLDAGGGVLCTGCATGVCETDGGCRECVPSADTCATGTHCSESFRCIAGCTSGASCQSGRCLAGGDCFECTRDSECSRGQVCGTGVCAPPCTGTTCGDGGACCAGRCVEPTRDDAHCGRCFNACRGTEFCEGTACLPVTLAGACELPLVYVVLDGVATDEDGGYQVARALAASCSPAPAITAVSLADAGVVLDSSTGQPFLRGGAGYAIVGGPYRQTTIGALERAGATEVRVTGDNINISFVRSDGGVLIEVPFANATPTHDWFLVELVKDPTRGAVALVTYGFSSAGTAAGAWYLAHRVLPMPSAFGKSWYVVEWTDTGDATAGDSDTFTPIAEGP